jgi:hypothetical protein
MTKEGTGEFSPGFTGTQEERAEFMRLGAAQPLSDSEYGGCPLDQEIAWEEFQRDLEHLKAWIGKQPRSRRSWLYSVGQWARGDR